MLRDVIFFDEARTLSYLGQAESPRGSSSVKASVKLPFGTGVEWSPRAPEESGVPEAQIDRLLGLLRDSGQLSAVRPSSLSAIRGVGGPLWVHEVVAATRVLLPLPDSLPGGPQAITVWVAEPDVTSDYLSPENHNFHPIFDTAFLFLLQEHWPDTPTERMISGCSALQMVANIAAERAPTQRTSAEWPPIDLGRGNPQHPVAKLAELGGLVLGSRKIESLYRVRYISNEQSYRYMPENHDGSVALEWTWLRVHDVLAYPLFIAAEV